MPDPRDAGAPARAIETPRLVLCGFRLEDFADSAALWADPDVTRFIGGRPSTEEESWTRFLRYLGHWSAMGFGYWAVREKATGRYVGEVGFADYRRDIEPSLDGAPEIGWVLAAWAHGQGFATEAVGAALGWADRNFGTRQTVCIINPDHERSIRVARKAGFKPIGSAIYKGQPILRFSRPAGRRSTPDRAEDASANR